tara:strand:- start:66966 stop:69656 length:2691 start_codon:yes stop_codon:yes gene_type:complete
VNWKLWKPLVLVSGFLVQSLALHAEVVIIRAGIYSNPPKVFVNDAGQAAGFWPDLTRSIAQEGGYRVKWIHGTWEQNLERLRKGEIHVMVDVAVTPERKRNLLFGAETVHVSWSRIYAAPGQKIQSIPDLQRKRIAALSGSINLDGPEGLRNLLSKFAVEAEIVPMSDYGTVFQALENGLVDAAVTNRDFGNQMEEKFDIIRTPILFQPADLRFAFAPNSPFARKLKSHFDASLAAKKRDQDSDFYRLQGKWLGLSGSDAPVIPDWLKWVVAGLLGATVILLGGLMLVEMRVRARTRQIQAQQKVLRLQDSNLKETNSYLSHLLASRRSIINSLPAHIALLDGGGQILEVNEQWQYYTESHGYSGTDFPVGRNYPALCATLRNDAPGEAENLVAGIRSVLSGEKSTFSMEYPAHSQHKLRWFKMTVGRLISGDPEERHGAVVMHIDVSERKMAELELNRLAFQDAATGLPSRIGFVRSMRRRMDRIGWHETAVVIVMDIVAMRDINDVHGYDVGDEFLFSLGHRLREQAGDRGLAGRTGGDEFVLYLAPDEGEDPAEMVRDLAVALSAPFILNDLEISVNVRYGYTVLGRNRRSMEDLMRESELALFRVREEIGQTVKAYSHELSELTRQRIELTREIRKALTLNEFEMYFQPKVDLETGELNSAEALIRWNHPERGMQSPAIFIPVAEKSQLISQMGDWILETIVAQLARWQQKGMPVVPVAINVSLVQFRNGAFAERINDLLRQYEVGADLISLEITESIFEQESPGLRSELEMLRESGIRLALDDFGTGYSSLQYLQNYPFHEIKIDQSFVRKVHQPSSREIVRTVLGLANALSADVVAEGIETREVLDALLGMGCRLGQGYYFSRPVPAHEFEKILLNPVLQPENTSDTESS